MSTAAFPESEAGTASVGTNPKVLRSVGAMAGWLILSFGLYGLVWVYQNLNEIGDARQKDTGATLKTILFFIPIANIFALYLTWKEVDEFIEASGEEGFNVVLYTILTLFIPLAAIFTYISVQNKLNSAWERSTGGAAQAAELGTGGKVVVGLGALFWVFYIGIVVIVGALN